MEECCSSEKIKDLYLKETINLFDELNDFERDDDIYYHALFQRINYCLNDIKEMQCNEKYASFLFLITEIDMVYECTHTIFCDLCENSKWTETEDMFYFKFVRDFITHPDGITNKKYRNNQLYARFCTEKKDLSKRVICRDFMPTNNCQAIKLASVSNKLNQHLFNKEYKSYFVLVVVFGGKETKNIICPYDKIWQALEDVIKILHDVYISHATRSTENV